MNTVAIRDLNVGSTTESIVSRAARQISEISNERRDELMKRLGQHLSKDDLNNAWKQSAPGKAEAEYLILRDELA